jgi:hypothetical protein
MTDEKSSLSPPLRKGDNRIFYKQKFPYQLITSFSFFKEPALSVVEGRSRRGFILVSMARNDSFISQFVIPDLIGNPCWAGVFYPPHPEILRSSFCPLTNPECAYWKERKHDLRSNLPPSKLGGFWGIFKTTSID